MKRYIYEIMHPEIYHGHRKSAPFFEGWYYKVISADGQQRYAIIPGIFKAKTPESDHAFVQILNGMTGEATYHSFPADHFDASLSTFEVYVGENHFRADHIELNINDKQLRAQGQLKFSGGTSWPVSIKSPGVMGWYAWLPFMETYHGILSFDHHIDGELAIRGENLDFSNGRGYIEKDWGQAFPAGYVWMQSNHFPTTGTCLTASIALIPSLGYRFRGFLVGLFHDHRLYRFTTYTGATTEELQIDDDRVTWQVQDRDFRLVMAAERTKGSLLFAPVRTKMHKRVNETLKSSIQVTLSHRDDGIIYEGTGEYAGLEVHGDLEALLNTR